MPDEWIEIVDWNRFQHYTDRRPVWIKVYTELLDDEDFLSLPESTRSLLFHLWLLYATTRAQVPHNTRTLSRRLRHKVMTRQLERLIDAGYIRISASKPLAMRYQDASLDVDVEKKRKDSPKSPQSQKSQGQAKRRAEAWIHNGLADQVPADHLAEVIADEFHIQDPHLVDELVTQAQAHR